MFQEDVMPIFEYVCRDCQHEFEILVSGETRPRCPECESRKLDKQISRFAGCSLKIA